MEMTPANGNYGPPARRAMVAEGEMAPEIVGTTGDGAAFRLSELRGHTVLLYFYPKADTPGCTTESKAFNERLTALDGHNVRVVGVSVDSVEDQCAFSMKYGFKFPLVADPTKAITKSYGVLGPFGSARRVSFVIDPHGKVVEVIESGRPAPHIAAADRLTAT